MFAQGDSFGLIALGISALAGAGGVIAFLFRALIVAKDREAALVMAEKDWLLAEKISAEKSYKELAAEALKSAIDTTNFYRAKEGKPPIIPLPAVVPEGHSPSDKKQINTAELQTMRATLAQVKVASGQEPRKEVTATGEEKLAVLSGAVESAVGRVNVVSDVVADLVEDSKKESGERKNG